MITKQKEMKGFKVNFIEIFSIVKMFVYIEIVEFFRKN